MKLPSISLGEWGKSITEPIIDFKKSRRYERQLKCTVIYIPDNGLAETYNGVLDEASSFLLVPELQRMYLDVHCFYLNGEKVVICPDSYHNTINFLQLKGFANALDYEADCFWDLTEEEQKKLTELIGNSEIGTQVMEKLKRPVNALRFHITGIKGTLNLAAFNNSFGSEFSHGSYRVTSSKILTFLEDTITRKIFLLSMVIAVGLGIGIGTFFGTTITTFIIGIIFMILKK